MSDWAKGYRAALADVRALIEARGLSATALDELLSDLELDSLVIDHEQASESQRSILRGERAVVRNVEAHRQHKLDL